MYKALLVSERFKKHINVSGWNDLIKLAEMIHRKEFFYYNSKFYNKNSKAVSKIYDESEKAWENFDDLVRDMIDGQNDDFAAELELGLIQDLKDHLLYWKYYMDDLVNEF